MTDPMDLLRRTTENLDVKERRTRASDMPLDSKAETFMGASIGAQSNLNLDTSTRRVRRPRRAEPEIPAATTEMEMPRPPPVSVASSTPVAVPIASPVPASLVSLEALPVTEDPSLALPKIPETLPQPKEVIMKFPSNDESVTEENKALESKISALEAQLYSLQIYPSTLSSFISDPTPSKVTEYIESLQNQVSTLQSQKIESPPPNELQEQIMDLQEDLQAAKRQITSFQTVINEKDRNIQDLQGKVNAMEAAMTESGGANEGGANADAAEAAIIEMAERELKMMEDLIKEQEAYISELEREMGGAGVEPEAQETINTAATEPSPMLQESAIPPHTTTNSSSSAMEKQLPPVDQ